MYVVLCGIVTGFAAASLLTYKNLESVTGMKPSEETKLQINSKVVTASVSNRDTDLLKDPVVLTFSHLSQARNNMLGLHCSQFSTYSGSRK